MKRMEFIAALLLCSSMSVQELNELAEARSQFITDSREEAK